MKKLVCDRCGAELIDDNDIDTAFEGREAWEASVRARGGQPRGIIPCEHFVRCGGEMQLIDDSKIARLRRRLKLRRESPTQE